MPPTEQDMQAERWLAQWHDRTPGRTPEAFADLRGPDGLSSYDRLVDLVRPGEVVLDLACGDGYLLERVLARHPAEAIGVDVSSGELEIARSRLPGLALHQARAQDIPVPTASVDLVICHMALTLMRPVDAVIAEVRRVLRPSGRFAAIVPGGPSEGAYRVLVGLLHALPFNPDGLLLGDRRTRSVEGLSELLHGFDLGFDEVPVSFESDLGGLWQFFDLSYNVALMAEADVRSLRRQLTDALAEVPRPLRSTLNLRRVVAGLFSTPG